MKNAWLLPLQSRSSSLHELYRRRVVHSHLHFGHSCSWGEYKAERQNTNRSLTPRPMSIKKQNTLSSLTNNAFLWRWWDDEALQWLLDRQLLKQTQEVAVAPPHREGLALKHGQRRLKNNIFISTNGLWCRLKIMEDVSNLFWIYKPGSILCRPHRLSCRLLWRKGNVNKCNRGENTALFSF